MAFNQPEDNIDSFKSAFEPEPSEASSDLNPQNIDDILSFEKTEKMVYFKNPWIQIVTLSSITLSTLWLFGAIFDSPEPQKRATATSVNKEIARLEKEMAELKEENRSLQIKQALNKQKGVEMILPPAPEPPPVEPEVELVAAKKIASPPPPRPVAKPRSAPPPKPKPVVKAKPPEPKIDPMEQWAKRANQGLYISSAMPNQGDGTESSQADVQYVASRDSDAGNLSEDKFVQELYSGKNSLPNDSNPQRVREKHPLYSMETIEERLRESNPNRKNPRPQVSNRTREIIGENSLYSRETIRERLKESVATETGTNNTEIEPDPSEEASMLASNRRETQILDIGSTAKAQINSSIVWTSEYQDYDRKYLITLEEDFENIAGEVILEEGTRLIAQAQNLGGSGLVDLEIIEIIKTNGDKIAVPSGAIAVEGRNGAPLKADLKRRGDSNFLAEVGSVIAPGVEEAFESTADTISFDGDSSSFSRISNRNRSPLESGISGLARGAGRSLDRRLSRNGRESVVSYFQLDGGTTVGLVIYEDLEL